MTEMPEGNEHPQGDKTFNGKTHQVFGHQNITKVTAASSRSCTDLDRGRPYTSEARLHHTAAVS